MPRRPSPRSYDSLASDDISVPLRNVEEFKSSRKADKQRKSEIELEKIKQDDAGFFDICRFILGTITPFVSKQNEERGKAWCMFVLIMLALVMDNMVSVYFSYVQRDYMTALQAKEEHEFYIGMAKTVGVIIGLLPIVAVYQYTFGWFVLEWRTFLTTSILQKYFHDNAYYHLKSDITVDNPDQRIGQDVRKFTMTISGLIVGVVDSVISLAAFFGVLYSISPIFSIALIGYSVLGTWISVWGFGSRLMSLSKLNLGQEADFRFTLVRVREHAESIAFYRGASVDLMRARESYFTLLATRLRLLMVNVQLKLFTRSFTWITHKPTCCHR